MGVLVTFLLLMSSWLLFTTSLSPGSVTLGLVVSVGAMLIFRRALQGQWIKSRKSAGTKRNRFHLMPYLDFVRFIPFFIGKILVSGLQITRLAFTPGVSFWPGIVKIKTDLPRLSAKTALATTITLTPGTLAIDYDQESDYLFIHWIDVSEYHSLSVDEQVTSGLRPWMRRIFP